MSETYIFFTSQFYPHVGGVERNTVNLAKRLKEDGHRVIIITNTPDDGNDNSHGFEVLRIPSFSVAGDRLRFYIPGSTLRKVLSYIEKIKNARVIVQTMLYQMSLLGVKIAEKKSWPCIVITHGSNFVCPGKSLVDLAEQIYEKTMAKLIKSHCPNIYSVSVAAADYLRVLKVPSAGVLYNSIDHSQIKKYYDSSDNDILNGMNVSDDSFVLCYIGRLIKEKGIGELVGAVKRLCDEGYNIELIVAGDGPMFDVLNDSHEKIHFIGEVSQEKVVNILKYSDAFILPSYSEGLPTSVMEAMVCKCYCVVSPYGGTKELIPDNRFGFLMDGCTEKDVYTALKYVYNDSISTLSPRENSYKRFFEYFTWERTVEKLYSAFENAVIRSKENV